MSSVLSFGPNVKYLDYGAYFVPVYLFLKILRVFEDPKLKFKSEQVRLDQNRSDQVRIEVTLILFIPCFLKSRIQLWFLIWFFGISISHDSHGMGRFGLNSHWAECSTKLSNRTIASQPCSAFSHLTLKHHKSSVKLDNNSYRSFPRRFFIIRGIGFMSRSRSGWRSENKLYHGCHKCDNVAFMWHLPRGQFWCWLSHSLMHSSQNACSQLGAYSGFSSTPIIFVNWYFF